MVGSGGRTVGGALVATAWSTGGVYCFFFGGTIYLTLTCREAVGERASRYHTFTQHITSSRATKWKVALRLPEHGGSVADTVLNGEGIHNIWYVEGDMLALYHTQKTACHEVVQTYATGRTIRPYDDDQEHCNMAFGVTGCHLMLLAVYFRPTSMCSICPSYLTFTAVYLCINGM